MEIYEVAGLSMEDKVVGSTGEQEHWEPNFRYVDSATNTHVNFYNIFRYYLHQFICLKNMMFPEKTGTELLLISEQGPTCFLTLFWLSEVKESHSSGQHHCSLLSASQSIG